MIEIISGSIEEKAIRVLQNKYPITIFELSKELHISKKSITLILKKFQLKGIVTLDILPDKTYVRLIRNDFKFMGKKRQRRFVKHSSTKIQKHKEYDGNMYS